MPSSTLNISHSPSAKLWGASAPLSFFSTRVRNRLYLRNDLAGEIFNQSALLLNCRDKIHHIEPLPLQCLQPFDDFIRLTRKTERLDNLRRDEAGFFWVEITKEALMHFLMLARPVAFLKKTNIIITDRFHLVRRVFAGLFPALNQIINVHHDTGADLPNNAFRIKSFPRLEQ